jgi:hypothetical protein
VILALQHLLFSAAQIPLFSQVVVESQDLPVGTGKQVFEKQKLPALNSV